MSLTVSTHERDGITTVNVAGEVDVSCASQLRDALDAALERGVASLEVDLSKTPYIDSTGIGVLVGTAHRAAEAGTAFVVAHPQRNVARVLGMLGVNEELGIRD